MKAIYLLLLTSLFLVGCGGVMPYKAPITQGIVITEDMLASLQTGLNKQQVRELLGPNYGENPFQPYLWEYIYTSTDPELHPGAIARLQLEFDQDGYLKSWQRMDETLATRPGN